MSIYRLTLKGLLSPLPSHLPPLDKITVCFPPTAPPMTPSDSVPSPTPSFHQFTTAVRRLWLQSIPLSYEVMDLSLKLIDFVFVGGKKFGEALFYVGFDCINADVFFAFHSGS